MIPFDIDYYIEVRGSRTKDKWVRQLDSHKRLDCAQDSAWYIRRLSNYETRIVRVTSILELAENERQEVNKNRFEIDTQGLEYF